jgi:hypothetical protein
MVSNTRVLLVMQKISQTTKEQHFASMFQKRKGSEIATLLLLIAFVAAALWTILSCVALLRLEAFRTDNCDADFLPTTF